MNARKLSREDAPSHSRSSCALRFAAQPLERSAAGRGRPAARYDRAFSVSAARSPARSILVGALSAPRVATEPAKTILLVRLPGRASARPVFARKSASERTSATRASEGNLRFPCSPLPRRPLQPRRCAAQRGRRRLPVRAAGRPTPAA